jgi:mannose-6-phosphate isomerase-like protein (cupin superfamily)
MDHCLSLENRHNGEILRMRRVHDAQGQIILILDGSMPPRTSGPPLHVHLHEHEEIIVSAGTLGAQIGTEKIVVPAGGAAVMPAGVFHRWWNAGDDLLELSGKAVPAADVDRFLQGLFAVLNASSNGRPSIFHMAHVLWRHRETQLLSVPPPAIQRIVFNFLAGFGNSLNPEL